MTTMKTIAKLAVCVIAGWLAATPTAGANTAPIPSVALDVDRPFRHLGSSASAEDIHRARLNAGATGVASHDLAEDGEYLVETTPEMVASDQIDPVTFDECHERHNTLEPPYWFKNKYNVCSGIDYEVKYFDIENGQPKYVGSSFFLRTFIGIGQDADNTIRFGVRLAHWYDVGTTYKDQTRLSLRIGCLNVDPARQSTCTTSPAATEKTVRQWELDGAAGTAWFVSTFTTTAVPADKYAAEKRGYFSFDLVSTLQGPWGVPDTDFSATEHIRCDEATYVSGSSCVFSHVASTLSLYANDATHGESARFIRDAQVDITTTKPGLSGKKVPGRWGEEPLHRLYHLYDTENDIKGSHRKVRRTCQVYWGVGYTVNAEGESRQCDEYPFATTYENAARINESSALSFAVRPINALHNETAGQTYGRWLGYDHILDGDPFYVIIR